MENSQVILEGASQMEKGAYLGVIASLASADRHASIEELEYMKALCEAADLNEQQTEVVHKAASEINPDDVTRCLDILKTSELRFSLVTDLIAFAKADNNYVEEEQHSIEKIAQYLGLNQQQFSVLNNFAEKASEVQAAPNQTKQGFMESLGLEDKLQGAGIKSNSLLKGLIGIAAPLILSKMMNRRGAGSLGGVLGGNVGGLGGMTGGGRLGSLLGMLTGGKGMSGMGSILGGLFGKR